MKPELTSLRDVAPGTAAVVHDVADAGGSGARLLELGLVPGTAVRVVRRGAVTRDVHVLVRGCQLAIGDPLAGLVRLEITP